MKRCFAALLFGFVTLAFSLTVLAQSPMAHTVPAGDFPARPNVGEEQQFRRLHPYPPTEPRVIKEGRLAPSPGDRTAFATFLKDKNTGLIRLLPREGFEREEHRSLNPIVTGGPYFSFANRSHRYGYGSDIELSQNNLSVGFAGVDFGMMTNIGDTPLDQITMDDLRLMQINAYRPPRPESEARAEYRRTGSPEGMTFDGLIYRRQLPVQENSTYLLRSISYAGSDRGTDVLVAFRLVRKDTDGSVIIAWKLLKRYPVPQFERNE